MTSRIFFVRDGGNSEMTAKRSGYNIDSMMNDFGIYDYLTPYVEALENILALPYDAHTRHDLKNLVCYMILTKHVVHAN